MSSLFSFTTTPVINISFRGQEERSTKKVRIQGQEPEDMLIYSGTESVGGTIDIIVPGGKKIDHLGVKIEMIGHIGKYPKMRGPFMFCVTSVNIELYFDRGNTIKFTALVRELESSGSMSGSKVLFVCIFEA